MSISTSEYGNEGENSNQKLPKVVSESFGYLKQLESSRRDMNIPAPILSAEPEAITAIQERVLEEQVKDIRSEILRGKELTVDGKTVYTFRRGGFEVFSSSPQEKPIKGRVFWLIHHGNDDRPEIFFNWYATAEGNKFSLSLDFGKEQNTTEPLIYESGVNKIVEMEKPEYAVVSHALTEIHKLTNPDKHV